MALFPHYGLVFQQTGILFWTIMEDDFELGNAKRLNYMVEGCTDSDSWGVQEALD